MRNTLRNNVLRGVGFSLRSMLSLACYWSLVANADLYQGEQLNIDGDIRLKLAAIDEIPVDAGVRLPELNYSTVVTSLWASWQQTENIRYKVWLKTEFRNYVTNQQVNNYRFLDEFAFHELSVEYSNLFDGLVDVKVGRFPLYYGNGLLILESSPLDAERSYGFNGIKTHFRFEHFDLDLIGIYAPREDELLINNKHKDNGFVESDEEGFVAYMINKTHPWLPKDLYYMYKHEAPRFGKEDIYFHTVGFIWETQPTDNISTHWELAQQRGHRGGDVDTRGWLSDIILTYKLGSRAWRPEFYAGNYFLSGDDPSTQTEENWHGLWARWPQYSYLMAWQFIPKIGEWSNINWTRVGARVYPRDGTSFEVNVGPIAAPEKGLGGGNERGNLMIMILRQQLSQKLSVMARAEIFEAGDFHPDENGMSWLLRLDFQYGF